MATSELVIFGSGGHAREVLQLVEDLDAAGAGWKVLGFLDDHEAKHGQELAGLPILGGVDWLAKRPGLSVHVAIGSPRARRAVVESILSRCEASFPNLVHPQAWIASRAEVGVGVAAFAGSRVNATAAIGDFAILNLNATVSHDSRIGAFTSLSPGVHVPGNVHLGAGCDIGTGASFIPGVRVGERCIVGAGAAVIHDLPEGVTAVGVPARAVSHSVELRAA